MVHTRALLFLVTTTAMAAMDPARFQIAGYGPQPGDLGAQVEVSGGEVMVPQPLDQDAKTKPGDAIAAKTERVQPFLIDRTAVTNAQFRRFIEDTGFQTEADLAVWSLVQKQFLRPGQKPNKMHPSNVPKHWTILKWSTWNKPEANGSSVEGARASHPAVHMSWNDAHMYCLWAGRRLPSEAEWEVAARGGLVGKRYPWGDEPLGPAGEHRANAWDGPFPRRKEGFTTKGGDADGFLQTCPADAFEPNAFGMFNAAGNVWEWTMSQYRLGGGGLPPMMVMKGGSHIGSLDGSTGDHTIGNAARTGYYPDHGQGDIGFRCASSLPGNSPPAEVALKLQALEDVMTFTRRTPVDQVSVALGYVAWICGGAALLGAAAWLLRAALTKTQRPGKNKRRVPPAAKKRR